MWNLTKEAKTKFLKCNLLPIHETDEEWEIVLKEAEEEGEDYIAQLKEELEEVKEELLTIIPNRFIAYVEDGTLNQPTLPKNVREEYLNWMRNMDQEFEQVLGKAANETEKTLEFLPQTVQEVFEESLHDAFIERIKREGNDLHIFLNMDGGFSTKAYIQLIFHEVLMEDYDQMLQEGQFVVYYELRKVDEGFAFRILLDSPESQWTITMKEMDASYYYRPVAYTQLSDDEFLQESSFTNFIEKLNPELNYWLITPDLISPIQTLSPHLELENGKVELANDEWVVTIDEQCFRYAYNEYHPIQFIYTDVYEKPYEEFEISLPIEKLETAALGEDIDLQVRAWNTMYANSEELSETINRILSKIYITEENEMLLTVFINHFYETGILNHENIKKFRSLLG